MTNHHLISDSNGLVDKHGKAYKFNCEPCNFHTNKSCNYTAHIICDKHKNKIAGRKKEKKIHYCQHCPYSSIRPYAIKIHNMTQHENKTKIKDFKCQICNLEYDEIEHYKNHLETNEHVKKSVKAMLKTKEQIDLQRQVEFIQTQS